MGFMRGADACRITPRALRSAALSLAAGVLFAGAAYTGSARADDPAPAASLGAAEIASAATLADTASADDTGANVTGDDRQAARGNPTPLYSTREGFDAQGRMKPAFEFKLWVFLPAVNATIGLNRPPGQDIVINRPRPTIADVVNKLDFAITCDCLVRYGDWSAEVTLFYVGTEQKTTFAPLPPALPAAKLNSKFSLLYVSPGIGYRVLRTDLVSLDLRGGFTYTELSADADFAAGQFAGSKSYTPSFTEGWEGWRFNIYPSQRWRIENNVAVTGIGDKLGWDADLDVSYLIARWFEVSLGYRASESRRDPGPDILGRIRGSRILLHGPVLALGFRF
jgi:hypothetical protein